MTIAQLLMMLMLVGMLTLGIMGHHGSDYAEAGPTCSECD